MRCLALAQAWQDAGGRAVFAMAESTDAVLDLLRTIGLEVLSVSAEQDPTTIRGRPFSRWSMAPNGWSWMVTNSERTSSAH